MKSTIIKFAIAFAIFLFIFYRVGFGSVYTTAIGVNPLFIALAFATLVCSLFLDCINLKVLLSPFGSIGMRKLFKNYCSSWALGLITPGKVGEFSISYFLKDHIPMGSSAAAYMIDKLTTILIMVLLSIMGFFMFFDPTTASFLVITFIIFWIAGIVIFFSQFGRGILKKYILRKRASLFEGFFDTFISYVKIRKKLVVTSLLLSALRWTINCFVVFLVFIAFNQEVPFIVLLAVVPLSSLASILPITFSGLGIREGVFTFSLLQIGIASHLSVTVSLFLLLIDYSLVFVFLIFLLRRMRLPSLWKEN